MTIELYEKQNEVVNEIKEKIEDFNLTKNAFYLSGEMGTGKTYMGVKMLSDYIEKGYKVLLVSPKQTITKWNDLIENENHSTIIQKGKMEYDTNKEVNIVPFEQLNVWTKGNIDGEYEEVQTSFFEEISKNNKILLVVDEVHLATKTRYDALERIVKKMRRFDENHTTRYLYLTGTIMESDNENVSQLLALTHDYISSSVKCELDNNFPRFIYLYWCDIAVSVSIDDIQALQENRQEIKQEIAPINEIPITTEQDLFMDVVETQLQKAGIDYNKSSSISSSFVDNPEKDLVYRVARRVTKHSLKKPQFIDLAFPLTDMNIQETSKFKKLIDIINHSKNDKILVYVNDEDTIETLINKLNDLNISAFGIKGVKPENYSEHINAKFDSHKVCVANPEKVNVGIDIHAEQLIWYQLMTNIDKMIQAQRRVCRLSSKGKSLVTLFVYNTRFESQKAKELSESFKHNAITYGVKQEDNLAKLTGILLEGIN